MNRRYNLFASGFRALRSIGLVAAACGGLLLGSNATAQNVIEDVSVAKGAAGRTNLTFSLKDNAAAAPSVFAIASPPRLVLDFPNTSSATKPAVDVSDAVVRSYNVVQAQGRTRVVLNLLKTQSYDVKVDGSKISLSLFDAAGTATADASP
ncbi:MAG: AMIN domain-containing protein, partial [Casimicrobium sp.]